MDYSRLSPSDQASEFLLYTAANGEVKVEVLLSHETLWLTQKRMAELFGVGVPAISKHLKNIFENNELDEPSVVSILETTATDGKVYQTKYYNLDAVISVGYRIIERRNSFTMASFAESVNKFLAFNEYRILEGYGSVTRTQAELKASSEYDKFNKQQRIESDFDREIKKLLNKKDK